MLSAVAISCSTSPLFERMCPDEMPTFVSPQAEGPPVPRWVTYIRIALGFCQAGAGVSVGVSVGVSLGVSVAVGVSVGVLVGLAVDVDVLVGVTVKVCVAGICVRVGGTVSVGISVTVAVGGNAVSEEQAKIREALANIMEINQKSRLFRIVDFSLSIAPKGRLKLYRISPKYVAE